MLVLPWELQGQTMPNHFERQRQTTFAPHMWLKHFYTFLRSLCGFVHGTPIEWHCHYNNWKRLQMFAFPAHWWNQRLKPGFQHRNYNIYRWQIPNVGFKLQSSQATGPTLGPFCFFSRPAAVIANHPYALTFDPHGVVSTLGTHQIQSIFPSKTSDLSSFYIILPCGSLTESHVAMEQWNMAMFKT